MAKESMKQRELKREKLISKFSEKRAALKKDALDTSLSYEERMEAMVKLQKLPRDSSPSRHQRRCQITGRPHAVYRKFGISRIKLREHVMSGDVPGVRKASW